MWTPNMMMPADKAIECFHHLLKATIATLEKHGHP